VQREDDADASVWRAGDGWQRPGRGQRHAWVADQEEDALVAVGEFNELGAAYFAGQGFDVVSSASAGLSQDPRAVEPAAVFEWASRHVADAAQAVFIGGNGFRAAGAIEALETAIGRPVLTSNQVLLWHLLAQVDAAFEIHRYGRLFAHKS